MTRAEGTAAILAAKKQKGVSFKDIAQAVGGHEVWVTSAILGQNSMDAASAEKLTTFLGLGPEIAALLQECPLKGSLDPTLPVDPLIYRFYEIMQVYGTTIKAIVHEKFGDGIMSAIDFTLDVQKQADPKGDRVVVTMNGKFLPYKRW